jgi:hypothetical protein
LINYEKVHRTRISRFFEIAPYINFILLDGWAHLFWSNNLYEIERFSSIFEEKAGKGLIHDVTMLSRKG